MDNLRVLADRRTLLSERIAHQRRLLYTSYEQLEPTMRYIDYGVEGVRFFRKNTILVAMSTATTSYVGGRLFSWIFGGGKKQLRSRQEGAESGRPAPGGKKEFLLTLARRLWQAYQLYRHVRNQMP